MCDTECAMVALSTSRLSSKGQVVIPEEVRTRLGLKKGCKFIVLAERGAVVFRVIDEPSRAELRALVDGVRKRAKRARVKRSDVASSIRRARKSGGAARRGSR